MAAHEDEHALLARFADRQSAEKAMAVIEGQGWPARRVDLIPPPTKTGRFHARRLLWGASGALAGAAVGALLAGVLAVVMNIEQGMIVGGPAGVILTGAVIGGLLLGTLGLIAGLGVGESKAPKEVSTREIRDDDIPGEALVRVWMSDGADDRTVRDALTRAGALSVDPESHSEWADERVLRTREIRARTA